MREQTDTGSSACRRWPRRWRGKEPEPVTTRQLWEACLGGAALAVVFSRRPFACWCCTFVYGILGDETSGEIRGPGAQGERPISYRQEPMLHIPHMPLVSSGVCRDGSDAGYASSKLVVRRKTRSNTRGRRSAEETGVRRSTPRRRPARSPLRVRAETMRVLRTHRAPLVATRDEPGER